jgi:hypothetical protein
VKNPALPRAHDPMRVAIIQRGSRQATCDIDENMIGAPGIERPVGVTRKPAVFGDIRKQRLWMDRRRNGRSRQCDAKESGDRRRENHSN